RSGLSADQIRGELELAPSSNRTGPRPAMNDLDALEALQERIAYRFRQPALLTRALTHRSFGADHNERLEFVGDAVLSLAVSSLLFQRFAGSDEGDLTRVRAHLVREDTLH